MTLEKDNSSDVERACKIPGTFKKNIMGAANKVLGNKITEIKVLKKSPLSWENEVKS